MTAERQDRGRVLDGAQGGGVAGLVAAEEPAAKGLECCEPPRSAAAREGMQNRALASAALGQLRQGGKCHLGGAEAGEELVEGDRPRYYGANATRPLTRALRRGLPITMRRKFARDGRRPQPVIRNV